MTCPNDFLQVKLFPTIIKKKLIQKGDPGRPIPDPRSQGDYFPANERPKFIHPYNLDRQIIKI